MLINPTLIENKEIKLNEQNVMYLDIGDITNISTNFKWVFDVDENFIIENNLITTPKKKIIKKIESTIRQSIEYKEYIRTLKYEFDMSKCKFFNNLDINEEKFSLEFHHYPLSLYDIVEIVINDKLNKKKTSIEEFASSFNIYEMADIIVKNHYLNKIGLVPLSKTIHELAHSGGIFIPLTNDYVFGKYEEFLEDYKYSIETNLMDKIKTAKNLTEEIKNNNKINNLDIIDIKIIKLIEENILKPEKINNKIIEKAGIA